MLRRTLARLVAALLVVCVCALVLIASAGSAHAQQVGADGGYGDTELIDALTRADLLDPWIDASGISASASLVEIVGSTTYQGERSALLAGLERLAEQREQIDERATKTRELIADVEVLEDLTRSLRREVANAGRSAAVSLTSSVAEQARDTLATVSGAPRWIGVSLDPLALAQHRLVSARDDLTRHVDALSRSAERGDKRYDATIARFTDLHDDLQRVRSLIETTNQRAIVSEFEYSAARAVVVGLMAPLHEVRLLQEPGVACTLEHEQLRVRQRVRQLLSQVRWRERVELPGDDQGRHLDGVQDVPRRVLTHLLCHLNWDFP